MNRPCPFRPAQEMRMLNCTPSRKNSYGSQPINRLSEPWIIKIGRWAMGGHSKLDWDWNIELGWIRISWSHDWLVVQKWPVPYHDWPGCGLLPGPWYDWWFVHPATLIENLRLKAGPTISLRLIFMFILIYRVNVGLTIFRHLLFG